MTGSRSLRLIAVGLAASLGDVLGEAGSAGDIAALAADDECAANLSPEECALNALQLRGVKSEGARPKGSPPPLPSDDEDDEDDEDDKEEDEDPKEKEDEEEDEDHEAEEPDDVVDAGPFGTCGGDDYHGPTNCPKDYSCLHMTEFYAQCRPLSEQNWFKHNFTKELAKKSIAPLQTFYMYRAQAKNNYPMENVNMGTLGGMMWYLHNEIISCVYNDCDKVRRYGINRITRWKVNMRAPAPLYKAGMNFGIRYAFDLGQCTGPWPCDDQYAKYGFFVGCNNLSTGFPFPDFPVYYTGAWYTLPGSCSERSFPDKSLECSKDQPGGHCKGNKMPTGEGTCTYNIEKAGEISIDELEELDEDYEAFKAAGGEEYNKITDMGVNMTFWDGLNNTKANAARVKAADALFKKKYPRLPSDEELPPPPCDFDLEKFFPDGVPTEENHALENVNKVRLGK